MTTLTYREVLRLPVMRRVWHAQVASLLGDWLAVYAIISVISFRLNGSPSQIAWVQIASMLPLVVLGPLAGVYVDRWPIKPVLVASDLVRAALVVVLFFTTSLWQIYAVLIAMSCASSFFVPAQAVTIRHYVPHEGLLPANTLMQLAAIGTRIVGPADAGALVAAVGAPICYAIDLVSFVASAALIGSVAIHRPIPRPDAGATNGKPRATWRDMTDAIAALGRSRPAACSLVAMASAMFMIGCFAPLVAPYIRDSLHGGSALFGLATAVSSIGMFVGMRGAVPVATRVPLARVVTLGLAALGGGVVLLGAVPTATVLVSANFVVGCGFALLMAAARTLLQQETPPALMGRVASAMTSVISFAQIGGMLLSGVLASLAGTRVVFLVCGAAAVALAVSGAAVIERLPRRSTDGEPLPAYSVR